MKGADPMNDETMTVQEQEPQQPDTEKGSFKMDLYFWMQALAVALVLLILTFTLAGRVIQVVGSSMVPTLHEDDLMLLQSIGYTPKQHDALPISQKYFSNWIRFCIVSSSLSIFTYLNAVP